MPIGYEGPSYIVYRKHGNKKFHRSPFCARGRSYLNDPNVEVYARQLDLSDMSMVRVRDIPNLSKGDLCGNCVYGDVREAIIAYIDGDIDD